MTRISLILLAVQITFLSACAMFEMGTLEFRNVLHFSLSEVRIGNDLNLRICGLTGASALAVKRIDVVTENDELIIKPILALGREGLSGSFDYTIKVPINIKRVLFGEERYQIWPVKPPGYVPTKSPWTSEYKGCS